MSSKQRGAAILIITVILLSVALLGMFFAAQNSAFQQKSSSNQLQSTQAFQAAQGGLEFGLVYLSNNTSAIVATASGGYINYGSADSNLTNVTLANNSKFSVVYTNPTQNNYSLIKITSTGTGSDGTSADVITETVYAAPNTITYSSMAVGNISLVGGSTLTNTINNQNIQSGGTVTINNGASTTFSSGSSSQGNYKSDVSQNVASLTGLSEANFFQLVFNTPQSTMQSQVQSAGNYYNNSVSGGDYSQTLNGQVGKTIWINQSNVTLGQGATIGSSAKPVTLIVQGNLSIANSVSFYGFIYTTSPGGFNLGGGARIYGGMASLGPINISNGVRVVFQQFPTIAGSSAGGAYVPVPGSWKDYQ